ncbi:MAG: MBL fold metallo-hydrolase [Ruminococcaceae bacterium]|nr:MBL fold metallo-hydrolase [Oscillospiraceae bacterium]
MLIMWVIVRGGEKLKKILSLLLSLLLLFGAGCSETEQKTESRVTTEINEDAIKFKITSNPRADLDVEVAPEITSTYGLMRVHFIDVGQGDCAFIELGNGQTMLIDAGNNENGDEIVKYIEDLQYSDIDYVVATHPHEDHIGGMTEIIENFDIDIFYMPWSISTSYTYENMLDTLSEKRVEVHKAELGRTIFSSGPIEITVLSPEEDTEYSDLNDASAVVRLQYGETVFLFTGDAGEMIEEDLCDFNIDSDVLKVGHHGSETSSSEAFIQKVSPEIAIISCGENNSYGHPDEITLEILKEYDADIYRTDESGTIIITADQNKKISVDKKSSPIKEKAPPTVVSEVKEEEITEEISEDISNKNYVYRTATGKKFHRYGCSYLKSKFEITIEDARRRGLTPCSRCQP